jgi:hypothetical protein
MANQLMTGLWRFIVKVPPFLWEAQVHRGRKKFEAVHGALSDEDRLVHHHVVRRLATVGSPLTPQSVGAELNLPVERVIAILDDLERKMTFLYRNSDGNVVWAYPVTVEKTPHRVKFDTGEEVYAA